MSGPAGTERSSPVAPPIGTVTFLFTDIEGSTALLHRLGTERYEATLARHRELIRDAFRPAGGVEIATEGDSFFVVFDAASAAVAAAVDAQRRLQAEPWPAGDEVRVRMGLHTGVGALDRDGSYIGADVHRAARVGAAGHGGQVVLSSSTRALIGSTPIAGVALRALGEHRLKDLSPEPLFDLAIDGLASEFGLLRGAAGRADTLPGQLTTFVGREADVATIAELLGSSRIVTLTGPGGIGKSRLAIAVASAIRERFADGVAFVALEPIADPMLVATSIARALDIVESGTRSATELLVEHVASRRLLLVLDNFDQVLAAAPTIHELVRAGPDVHVLVTSRAPLRVSGEREYQVGGLPAPADPERMSEEGRARLPAAARRLEPSTIEGYPAVRLFVARGAEARTGFALTAANAPVVARIVSRLDGLPLAIELAAARLRLLGPEAILERLDRSLDFLASSARDLPERQRTLRAAIAWSYDLLEPGAQHLLDRLSVFRGGFELEMAERVVDAAALGIDVLDGLETLVDQSLVRRDDGDEEPRFSIGESIRTFAYERLAARGELGDLCERHADAFLELAEAAEPLLQGDDQRAWLERLERDHENIRAALAHATGRPLTPVALRLVAALWRFWQKRGYLPEGRRQVEAALALPGARDDPRLAARALESAGGVAWWQGDIDMTTAFYRESLALWRIVGDKAAIANAAYNFGLCGYTDRSWEPSRVLFDEALALFTELGDDRGIGNVQWGYGQLEFFARADSGVGREAQDAGATLALERFASAIEHFRRTGDRTMEAWSAHMTGLAKVALERASDAIADFQGALDHFLASGDLVGAAFILDDFAIAASRLGEVETSIILLAAVHEFEDSSGATLFQTSQALFPDAWPKPEELLDAPERAAELRAQGRALSFDEAVALARTIGRSTAARSDDAPTVGPLPKP